MLMAVPGGAKPKSSAGAWGGMYRDGCAVCQYLVACGVSVRTALALGRADGSLCEYMVHLRYRRLKKIGRTRASPSALERVEARRTRGVRLRAARPRATRHHHHVHHRLGRGPHAVPAAAAHRTEAREPVQGCV